jgi:UDP-GlcNAc:undecaprenyl-phosphate GlcNAc-1-phosphate transferase
MQVYPYLSAFLVAFLGVVAVTPLVKQLATAAGAIDRPNARKHHPHPTPLWGGLGLFFSLVLSVALVLWLSPDRNLFLEGNQIRPLLGMLCGGAMIVLTGMIDDRFNMPAKVKLACQLAVAAVMIHFGIRIDYLSTPFHSVFYLENWQTILLTTFWIVGITNAVNLLDGLDGLVAGVALGSSLIFAMVALVHHEFLVALVMVALAGCALGFLKYNFNPATIFMGDTGSLFIGLNFAGWSIVGPMKVTVSVALIIPVLIMAVPVFDTAFAIVRRSIARRPIFSPDRGHLHHRLLGAGLSPKKTVMVIYAINMVFGLAGLALAYAAQ